MDIGDRWAYRTSRSSSQFHEAVVLAIGTKRPPRVRIELLADEWEGERRWVPPARLEVRWDERHEYIELDRKQRAVRAWRPARIDRRTAEYVFVKLIPLELAEFNADSAGTSAIYDLPNLSTLTGLSQDDLQAAPAFVRDQTLTAPWPTTERIGRAVAARYPHALLTRLELEEREANVALLQGATITDLEGNDHTLSPLDVRARFEQRQEPYLNKLRDWIGVERAADLLERRELVARLGSVAAIATEALDVLEPSQKRTVARLRASLHAAMSGFDALPPSD